MITIKNYQGTTSYAENNKEYIDQLFNGDKRYNNGGTLALFKKVKKLKRATLYYTEEHRGYFQRVCDDMWGQFSDLEHGRYYQWTLDEIWRDGIKQK